MNGVVATQPVLLGEVARRPRKRIVYADHEQLGV